MKKKIIPLLFLFLLLLSCNTDNPTDNEFNNYIEDSLKLQLPTNNALFIFIKMEGCKGCIYKLINNLKEAKYKENSYLIFCDRFDLLKEFKLNRENFINYKKVIVDNKNCYENLQFCKLSSCVVVTKNKKIVSKDDIDYTNYPNIMDKLQKFVK